jgi:hypothetical protein
VVHGSGEWLGAEAARRLATLDGVEVVPPRGVEVVGLLGRAELHPPLTDAEFTRVQDSFAFEFADDHRALLAAGLPLGEGWPDWRHGRAEQLRDALTSPAIGVLFDVEHNVFWDHRWGERPADTRARLQLAAEKLAAVPHMMPVYAHRYSRRGMGRSATPSYRSIRPMSSVTERISSTTCTRSSAPVRDMNGMILAGGRARRWRSGQS